jgi:hypothetical protein
LNTLRTSDDPNSVHWHPWVSSPKQHDHPATAPDDESTEAINPTPNSTPQQRRLHPMTGTGTPSAETVLADILAALVPEANTGQDSTRTHQSAAEAFTALSVGGYACIKLPPALPADEETACAAFSGANTVYFAAPGEIDSDNLRKWKHRVDATALLAAAHTADTMKSKQ